MPRKRTATLTIPAAGPTLWDLLERPAARRRPPPRPASPEPPSHADRLGRTPAADRYHTLEREMLARYGVRVRKWRSSTSGVAWQVYYRDGSVARLIESPRPRGPISAAVFLHEIGHHAIGFETYRVRCVEELHAWRFALEQMELHGLNITPRVRARVRDALRYALDKAGRRGLRAAPPEVLACIAEQERLLAQSGPGSKSASTKARGSNG